MNRVATWLQAAWKAMALHFPGPRWGWQSVALGKGGHGGVPSLISQG